MAIVNVWYPKIKSKADVKTDGIDVSSANNAAYSLLDNVGHASLTLNADGRNDYLSWWPDKTHTSFATPSFTQDVAAEKCQPTFQTELNCLDEVAISNWWRRVKFDGRAVPYKLQYFPADTKWTLERNNCSHMVALAMVVGGANEVSPRISFGTEMVTPPQIHVWATRLAWAGNT
jgi:hypothetical protein